VVGVQASSKTSSEGQVMKALTISQPYASLIASGEKWVENRTWQTSYRGELAIHAGLGSRYLKKEQLADYPTGCVIAIARLVACVSAASISIQGHDRKLGSVVIPGSKVTWLEALTHKHAEGPWCWILEDVRTIDPVQVRGAQQLWEFDYKSEVVK